jgi:hypothetical protein
MDHQIHQVTIVEQVGDFTLHDWPSVRDDFARLAQTWAAAHA